MVKSYVFYEKDKAREWIEKTIFPKVFKLRSGAGSYNVFLIKDKKQALKYLNQAFGRGFFPHTKIAVLRERIWHFKKNRDFKSLFKISFGLYRYIFPNKIHKNLPRERNYLYAQDFIDGCDHDIRVFVIGDRALTKKRFTRDGDFRASGSGIQSWEDIPKECIQKAFEVVDKIGAQSLAFDFVKDKDGYKIVEISYVASVRGFPDAPGYWDRNLRWIEAPVRAEFFILEDILDKLKS
jgi:glutathione synthase/RimK-type ligase-like ATP-grasp enzyme